VRSGVDKVLRALHGWTIETEPNMTIDRTELINRKITDLESAKRWIVDLYDLDLMFHFEDPPAEIGNIVDGKWVETFTEEEAAAVSQRADELYRLDFSDCGGCPIGYALAVMASPKVRVEFPSYDVSTLPASLSSWTDISCGNDSCPSFKAPGRNAILYVDYANPADREHEGCCRFSLHRTDAEGCLTDDEPIVQTDDFEIVESAVQAVAA
jgi:hypothetical protein